MTMPRVVRRIKFWPPSPLAGICNPQGRLAITVPLGYNPELDRLIERNELGEDRGWFLLRHGPREWKEVARHQAMGTPFGRPFPFANALLVAEFDAPN